MVDLNVTPDEEGIKLKCADIVLLSSLSHGGKVRKDELIEKVRERNEDGYIVDDTATSSDLMKRSLNMRLTENIQKEYIESDGGEFMITQKGKDRLDSLIEQVRDRID